MGIVFVGTISNAGVPGFGKKFTAPNLDTVQSPAWVQDDFAALVKRGNYFRAKCPAGHSPWRVRGVFQYSGTGQPADTWQSPQPCS